MTEPLASSQLDQPSAEESIQGLITQYLLERVSEFRELTDLRRKGWDNPKGDAFFKKQRQNADKPDKKTSEWFFRMMKQIAEELHTTTGAFSINPSCDRQPRILDFCMAPGGYLHTALQKAPGAEALAFSLPVSHGGHEVYLRQTQRVECRLLDVTMLAADMGTDTIPASHPEVDGFIERQLQPTDRFDLVLCDGQVLRTHIRPEYRESQEAVRLHTTQLVLGLEHLQPLGTMVVLLHKLEAYRTVAVIRRFCKFSNVKLFKPSKFHCTRSSFYMVATHVQSQHDNAIQAITEWKKMWNMTTFGKKEDYLCHAENAKKEEYLELENFGPELVRLGRNIWRIQRDALAQAPFIRNIH
ncbi:unnamed protein product [Clonostachys byssicola]|uniref:Ribosomal RNA methyltransferase FtsJ domain-containing protein n=1 Tax=Clonostachys byssicola TaxID=160290 RepID=A0A9N9V0S6_9HYPO|nr:unnamed protein product [Clonostachys byssicola]